MATKLAATLVGGAESQNGSIAPKAPGTQAQTALSLAAPISAAAHEASVRILVTSDLGLARSPKPIRKAREKLAPGRPPGDQNRPELCVRVARSWRRPEEHKAGQTRTLDLV